MKKINYMMLNFSFEFLIIFLVTTFILGILIYNGKSDKIATCSFIPELNHSINN